MRFLDLYIKGFGKFHDTFLSFEDGLNLIYGKNEAGKSTIHTFIRGMLYGIERQRGRAARNDLYSRYEPWEHSGSYEGKLRLEADGVIYRLERSFQKNRKQFVIINETRGREETPDRALLDKLLCGISETAYQNTVSIGQLKSATEEGMVSELKNYIANMNASGNMALNITKADAYLKSQKRELENRLRPEASKNFFSLSEKIRRLEQEISSPEYENRLHTLTKEQEMLNRHLEEKKAELDGLKQQIDEGRGTLAQAGFTDLSSVTSCLEQAEEIYRQYRGAFRGVNRPSVRLLPSLFLFPGLLLLLGAACFFYWGLVPDSPLLSWLPKELDPALSGFAASLGAAVSLSFGAFFFLRYTQAKKTLFLCSSTLSELFLRYLGDRTVSEASMKSLRKKMEEFSGLCRRASDAECALRSAKEETERLRNRLYACTQAMEDQKRIQWELEKKLEHLSELKDQAAALSRILSEDEKVREEIAAVELAQKTMKDLSMSIRDSFGLYLNQTASRLIEGITGGRYKSMSIDENLSAFLNTRNKLIPLEQVSSGTADQIYLALRLAAARFIQGGRDHMPLIFDDSFALYDEERLRTALLWLSRACKGQILLFTCHKREQEILEREKIPFHRISL